MLQYLWRYCNMRGQKMQGKLCRRCGSKAYTRHLCKKHYMRYRRGDAFVPYIYQLKTPAERHETQRKYRYRIKEEVINAYGGKCICCGEQELMFLSIDHVKGGGTKLRKQGKDRAHSLRLRLRRESYPPDFQVLCHNCNQSRGYYGRCPHE